MREGGASNAAIGARNGTYGCLSHYSPPLYQLSHRRTQKRNSFKGERVKRELRVAHHGIVRKELSYSQTSFSRKKHCLLSNGHVGDEHIVHCSQVFPSSEAEIYGQYIGRG